VNASDKSQRKVAIVTGAASGIGASAVERLARDGFAVLLVDVNGEDAERLAGKLRDDGHDAQSLVFDVRNGEGWREALEICMNRWGSVDVLFSNAGIIRDARVMKMTEEQWDDVVDICLKATWIAAKTLFPQMIEQKYGRIIATSSTSYKGNFGQANYSAAKGGLISLIRTLAIEGARYDITANSIAPGTINTPGQLGMEQKWLDYYRDRIPMKRFGEPEEVASLVSFLASAECSYVTGQLIHVCGGASVGA
jgi:NAD(P)-dependent dehydrogenase (short-subunit alcohol dehydrogenase family)